MIFELFQPSWLLQQQFNSYATNLLYKPNPWHEASSSQTARQRYISPKIAHLSPSLHLSDGSCRDEYQWSIWYRTPEAEYSENNHNMFRSVKLFRKYPTPENWPVSTFCEITSPSHPSLPTSGNNIATGAPALTRYSTQWCLPNCTLQHYKTRISIKQKYFLFFTV